MRRLTLVLAIAAGALAPAALADYSVSHTFDSTTALRGARRVVIDIPAGELHIQNGAANSIGLHGAVRRDYDGYRRRERSQRIVDDITPEVVMKDGEAVIRRRFGPNAGGWTARNNTNFDITIDLPAGIDVDVQTRFGEVHLDGAFGNVDVDLSAGEIHMTSPRANVRHLAASCQVGEVHTNLGDRTIDREGLFPGTTRFTNPNGGKGDVRLHVTAGEVHVSLK
jgi:hypothetical protein